jgi:transposase InsO family protein
MIKQQNDHIAKLTTKINEHELENEKFKFARSMHYNGRRPDIKDGIGFQQGNNVKLNGPKRLSNFVKGKAPIVQDNEGYILYPANYPEHKIRKIHARKPHTASHHAFMYKNEASSSRQSTHVKLPKKKIPSASNVHFEKDGVCSACQEGKKVGAHHPHKNIMTTDRPLELLHMDLFGLIAYISIDGSKYCLVIVDDYSRFNWVFFLQEKSQTQETLKGFLRRAQNEFGLRIKKIRSDNGTEFKNSQIKGFLQEEGIKHEFSSPYTPQQNGVVESKNRTLLDMARTMLDEYKTPDRFLGRGD